MKKYIYLIISKRSDGMFTTCTYETLEKAEKALEMLVSAQKDIQGARGNVYIDYHKYERLRFPEFIVWDDDILAHVTVNILTDHDGKDQILKTDRYIIRSEIN